MEAQYNKRSPAVKRLMKEAEELSKPTADYYAQPLDDNLFEWHFTVRGPSDSDFEGGIYHGRIILPSDYPMKPPNIIILTPNGRFEVNKKICLSISGHHPESWQPSWSIRTALLAIIGFMPTSGLNSFGSLDYTPEERKIFAKRSLNFTCQTCGSTNGLLKATDEQIRNDVQITEMEEIVKNVSFKSEEEVAIENNEDRQEEYDKIEIKKASLSIRQIYKEKFQKRQQEMEAKIANLETSAPSLLIPNSSNLNTSPTISNRLFRSIYDIGIVALVIAIIAILYRRLNCYFESSM